jgi:predicted dehydrogenase
MEPFRWGILGAARIARKNWKSIRRSGNSVVTAVGSRDPARAAQFIEDCQKIEPFEESPVIFNDYAKLIESPEVDGVYIPLPTGVRKDIVMRAAAAGKHVLCEKPCAPNADDLREMIAACQRNKVQFMDGVMFMHNPRLEQLRATLDDKANLGRIHRINSHFSFFGGAEFFTTNIRLDAMLEPLGCLGDLGWYCIRFSLWVMRWQMPRQVAGVVLEQINGVPTAFSGEMIFEGGVSANFYCSFREQHQQWVSLSCEKAFVRVPDFVLPLQGSTTAFEVNQIASRMVGCDYINEPTVKIIPNSEPAGNSMVTQETNMIRNFVAQTQTGTLNEDWPDMALRTQIVADACLSSARAGARLIDVSKE